MLPALLAAAAGSHEPIVTLERLLRLLHAVLCSLDGRPRLMPHDPAIDAARAAIGHAWSAAG